MRATRFLLVFLFFSLLFLRVFSKAGVERQLATLPPRGWNSYDSFSWIVDEASFLNNSQVVSEKLLSHGYEYVVVDYLWYRKNVDGASQYTYGLDSIDQWGRPFPDPDRFPSSRGGKGFTEIARKVHEMGLKFGIHVMRGISDQAVNSSTPILDINTGRAYEEGGKQWTARDIGLTYRTCAWMPLGFMSFNTDVGAGRAFLTSIYQQYADWGVDFVKLDCVFGDDYSPKEIIAVSEFLQSLQRPIMFSISPGSSVTPSLANGISDYVNMYRITGDDWDKWGDVSAHFDVSRDMASAKKIGAKGLRGNSWPDLDMLPLGWLTDPGVRQGPHRKCRLTLDEKKTQMTLWAMAKSPLMYGGDLTHIDKTTLALITNPTVLEIDAYSSNNMEFPNVYLQELFVNENSSLLEKPAQNQIHSSEHDDDDVVLGLSSCSDKKAQGWYVLSEDKKLEKICWNNGTGRENRNPFCLEKRKPFFTSDEVITHGEDYRDKFHLAGNETSDVCLDASVNGRRTAAEMYSVKLSSCKRHTNQIWELNENGTLTNSYSSLCAMMVVPNTGTVGASGVRSWIATGRRGEIYLALFNLNDVKARIGARLSDIRKLVGDTYFKRGSCSFKEVWSGENFSLLGDEFSAVVNTHGSFLSVLRC